MTEQRTEQQQLTVFGRVVTELMEECGVSMRDLEEQAHARGLTFYADWIEARMASRESHYPGSMSGFADALGLSSEERHRFAMAYLYEEDVRARAALSRVNAAEAWHGANS